MSVIPIPVTLYGSPDEVWEAGGRLYRILRVTLHTADIQECDALGRRRSSRPVQSVRRSTLGKRFTKVTLPVNSSQEPKA